MGNGQGKPVVFTDEGMHLSQNIGNIRRHDAGVALMDKLPFVRAQSIPCANVRINNSEPQSLPTIKSCWKGCLWQGADCGEKRYRIDFRTKVYPQR